MTDHLTKSVLERFLARSESASSLARITLHLEGCPECLGELQALGRERGADESDGVAWGSLDWLREEHLGYEEISGYVGDRLDEIEREMIGAHLRQCPRCEGDVASLRAHRLSGDVDSALSGASVAAGSVSQRDWNFRCRNFGWKRMAQVLWLRPAFLLYALILLGLLIGLFWFLRPARSWSPPIVEDRPPAPLESTPEVRESLPVPRPAVPQPVVPQPVVPRSPEALIALRDGGRTIAVDRRGRLTGLDELTVEDRRFIGEVLRSGELARPAILDDLGETEPAVRGETLPAPPFRLLAPEAGVLWDTRPELKWEALPDAAGYRVEIFLRNSGRQVISPFLPAATSMWAPDQPFERGETFHVTVRVETTKGEVIVAERTFKILGEREWRKLKLLRARTRSHLALGLSYARAGLIGDATRELQLLAEENQDSLLVNRLLLRLRGM